MAKDEIDQGIVIEVNLMYGEDDGSLIMILSDSYISVEYVEHNFIDSVVYNRNISMFNDLDYIWKNFKDKQIDYATKEYFKLLTRKAQE